jgi:protein SCO1
MQLLIKTRKFALPAMVLLALCGSSAAQAKMTGQMSGGADLQKNTRPSIFENVGIDQNLGTQIPLNASFKDELGRDVKLGDYFGHKRPVVLALVYFSCTMLCNQVLNGTASALNVLKFNAGKEFDVLAISFDPRETPDLAAEKKQLYLARYRRPGADQGWHFLTGKQPAIDAVTKSVGFHYAWDERSQQFAHSSALILITPDGKVAQYYYGIEYSPKDMRLGIIEASQEKLGNVVDQLILYCYHYDPMTGKYGAIAMNLMRLGGVLTVLGLGTFMVISFRREGQRS